MSWGVTLLAIIGTNGAVATYARMPEDVYSGWYETYKSCYEVAMDYNRDTKGSGRVYGCMRKPANTDLDGRTPLESTEEE